MKFHCYQLEERAPEIVPAEMKRKWMDETDVRSAYRCTPMTIANSSGWELILPRSFLIHWNGGPTREDLEIEALDDEDYFKHLAISHFGRGIVTFNTGYIFRTDPGWTIIARGSPNWPRDGIAPLEGIVETDWLPSTFVMNWSFTKPGSVLFKKGEPYCFFTPVPEYDLEEIVPEIHSIKSNPGLKEESEIWAESRNNFNENLRKGDAETLKQGWQRNYVAGKSMLNMSATRYHKTKLRVKKPVICKESD